MAGRPAAGASLARGGLHALDRTQPATTGRSTSERAHAAARLSATLAKSLVEIAGLEQALQEMDRAVAAAELAADKDLDALLAGQRGLILFRGGRLTEARRFLDIADAAIPRESGIDKWRILVNRGALFVESGEVAAARQDLQDAVDIARDHELRQAERIALHNLGCLEFTAGNLPAALRLIQQGIELDGETQQGIAYLDRSRVLLAAGLLDEADAALAQAAELFRRDRCWQDLAEVNLTRAEVALLTGSVAEARQLAGHARDRFRRQDNDRWRRNAELVLLQADHAAGRPAGRLLPPARRLAAEFAAAGFGQQAKTALLLAAELELDRHRPDAADTLLARLGTVGRTETIAVRLHHRLVRSVTLEQHGDLSAARRSLSRGLRELAAYQAQFGGIDLQSASAVHGRRLVERDFALAVRSGRAASVLSAVERSRAVTSRIQPVTPPADDTTAELLAELRRASESAARSSQDTAQPAPEAGTRRASASPDRRRIVDLQAQLRAKSWLNSGSRTWQPPAPLHELRAGAAADGCHLITITEHRGRIGAVTIPAHGRMQLRELAETESVRSWQRRLAADLDVLANAGLPEAMRAAVTRSLRHSAAELGRLLAPAVPDDDKPVVISPPGGILALPWPLLPPLVGRPVTITPSLSSWLWGRARLTARTPAVRWTLAAVAGPGLSRAQEEAGQVTRSWRAAADVRQLTEATPAELLDAMATCELVHIAAHGVHQRENPMFSSLSLATGPLFAYELDQRPQLPEHVVLSACDVGQSTVRATETLGLTSVLLQLGTASVVASVARVHDDVAAQIMATYHQELAGGASAAEALCTAAAQADEPSPFVCFGASWRR